MKYVSCLFVLLSTMAHSQELVVNFDLQVGISTFNSTNISTDAKSVVDEIYNTQNTKIKEFER